MQVSVLTRARILIVDDEEANVDLLEQLLARSGYTETQGITDPRLTVPCLREFQPDLILLDLLMPHLDGYAVMEQLRGEIAADDYLPILVLTADITTEAKQRALAAGARDFLTKPFDRVELLLRIRNLLETRFLHLRLRQQYASLERLYEESLAALRERNESLSAVTHDLGQPLATIRLATSLMRRESQRSATGSSDEMIAGIDAAATKMWGMIGELLDVARLDSGRPLDLTWDSADLVSLVRDELEEAQKSTTRHQLILDAAVPELPIDLDIGRIGRVVANLLNNAIKYSPEGGDITITVTREPRDGGHQWAVVRVADTGIGIPAADLPYVFERFHRGTNVSGRIQGSGVGLATARQIVEQHGGQVSVASEEGRGTTVTVRLPVEET